MKYVESMWTMLRPCLIVMKSAVCEGQAVFGSFLGFGHVGRTHQLRVPSAARRGRQRSSRYACSGMPPARHTTRMQDTTILIRILEERRIGSGSVKNRLAG